MAVIPLKLSGEDKSIATSKQEFEAAGGRNGPYVLIENIDQSQLRPENIEDSDVSYDLRVGSEYRDHRDTAKRPLNGESIFLLPGQAMIIETEQLLHLPKSRFGYVVPKVSVLQEGVSNTLSKVNPGYEGHLLVTLFNLGKKKYELSRGKKFCSLVVHDVADGATLYNKEAKKIPIGRPHGHGWRKFRDFLQSNADVWAILAILASVVSALVSLRHH